MRNEYHNLILSGLIYAQKLLIFTDLTETIIKIEVLIVFSKVRALIFLSWNNLLENLLKKKKINYSRHVTNKYPFKNTFRIWKRQFLEDTTAKNLFSTTFLSVYR